MEPKCVKLFVKHVRGKESEKLRRVMWGGREVMEKVLEEVKDFSK